MNELTLTTPALLFSAISLIMLAYTNRFLAYAAVIRNLHDIYLEKQDETLLRQIRNLKMRLTLTRWMQIFGIASLLLCVLTMFLIYVDQPVTAAWIFGVALLLLILSLGFLIWEIQISSQALQHHIADIEEHLKKSKSRFLRNELLPSKLIKPSISTLIRDSILISLLMLCGLMIVA